MKKARKPIGSFSYLFIIDLNGLLLKRDQWEITTVYMRRRK